jgi:ribosome modulation factor
MINGAAYREGQQAREDDCPREALPYTDHHPVARDSWLAGWDAAIAMISIPKSEHERLLARAERCERLGDLLCEVSINLAERADLPRGLSILLRKVDRVLEETHNEEG